MLDGDALLGAVGVEGWGEVLGDVVVRGGRDDGGVGVRGPACKGESDAAGGGAVEAGGELVAEEDGARRGLGGGERKGETEALALGELVGGAAEERGITQTGAGEGVRSSGRRGVSERHSVWAPCLRSWRSSSRRSVDLPAPEGPVRRMRADEA